MSGFGDGFIEGFLASYKVMTDADFERQRMSIMQRQLDMQARDQAMQEEQHGWDRDMQPLKQRAAELGLEGAELGLEGQALDNDLKRIQRDNPEWMDPARGRRQSQRELDDEAYQQGREAVGLPTDVSFNGAGDQSAVVRAVAQEALARGDNPLDALTLVSFETGGTFNPNQRGPRTHRGQHIGLIQYGDEERRTYDVRPDLTPEEHAERIYRYLGDRGYKPEMDFRDMYSTVNAGRPGLYGRSDGNMGTVDDKVNSRLMAQHRAKAQRLLQEYAGDLVGMATDRGIPDDVEA